MILEAYARVESVADTLCVLDFSTAPPVLGSYDVVS